MRVGLRFAVLILAGAACSSLGLNFREPDIQLDHAVVLQVGFDVEGSHLGDITYDNDFTVSENGTTTTTSVSFTHEGRAPLTRASTVAIPGVGPS